MLRSERKNRNALRIAIAGLAMLALWGIRMPAAKAENPTSRPREECATGEARLKNPTLCAAIAEREWCASRSMKFVFQPKAHSYCIGEGGQMFSPAPERR